MRKSSFFLPVLFLLMGAAGCYLRYTQLTTIFDEITGLPQKGTQISFILTVVCGAAIVLAALFGIIISARHTSRDEYCYAFNSSSVGYLAVMFILSVLLIVACGYILYELLVSGSRSYYYYIFPLLGILAGIGEISLAYCGYRGQKSTALGFFGVLPAIFACFWLVTIYKDHAADPTVFNYVFACLATVGMTLASYYDAGYVYKKKAVGRTVFSHLIAIFFCAAALFEPVPFALRVCTGAILFIQLFSLSVFLKNLRRKKIS